MTQLINIYHKLPYDVYIGRAGKGQDGYFGNPIKLEGDRVACIDKYREYFNKRIIEDAEFKARIDALKGETLGCFCYPALCHGMVIIEYLEGVSIESQIIQELNNDGDFPAGIDK